MTRSAMRDTKKQNSVEIHTIRRSVSFRSVDTTKGQINAHQHIAVTDIPKTPHIALFMVSTDLLVHNDNVNRRCPPKGQPNN